MPLQVTHIKVQKFVQTYCGPWLSQLMHLRLGGSFIRPLMIFSFRSSSFLLPIASNRYFQAGDLIYSEHGASKRGLGMKERIANASALGSQLHPFSRRTQSPLSSQTAAKNPNSLSSSSLPRTTPIARLGIRRVPDGLNPRNQDKQFSRRGDVQRGELGMNWETETPGKEGGGSE